MLFDGVSILVLTSLSVITADFIGAFRQNVIRVIGSYGKEQEPDEYEDKIKAKQQEMVALIAENAKTGSYTQEFDERYRSIAKEIEILKQEQAETRKKKRLAESYEQRVKDMDAFIRGSTCQIHIICQMRISIIWYHWKMEERMIPAIYS